MKKIILSLMAFGLFLASCNRNNDDIITETVSSVENNETTPTMENIFLTKIKKGGDVYEWHFTYDEDNHKISKISFVDDEGEYATRTFTYNDKDQIISSVYENPIDELKDEITYSYDAQGRLISSMELSSDGFVTETISRTYSYEADNKVIVNQSTNYDGEITENVYTYTLNDKGQVITKESTAEDGVITRTTYTYDEVNKTPFANVKGLSALLLVEGFDEAKEDQDEGLAAINNIIEIKEEQIGTYGTVETNVSQRWTYNEKGYPIQRIESRERVGVSINLPTKTYTYEYNQ